MIALVAVTTAVFVVIAIASRFLYAAGDNQGAQQNLLGICPCLLEPKLDRDFRRTNGNDVLWKEVLRKVFGTGKKPYIRPIGYQRFALKIAGKYDGGDDWLTGWRNAYSGTSIENAREIVRNGFHLDKMVRKQFGKGIYCTPDPETAKTYAREKGEFHNNGIRYLVVVQVRVDPAKCKVAKPVGQGPSKRAEYWTVLSSNAIRPYAICLFKA